MNLGTAPAVQVKSYQTAHNTYCIANSTVVPEYHSVVVDAVSTEVYAFSPPKSVSLDVFISTVGGEDRVMVNPQRTLITEVIEGTMVNLWYDRRVKQWEISTKTAVGGAYSYATTK